MAHSTSSHKYLLRIGGITAYWSVTEFMCDQALAVLMGIESDLARSVTRPGTAFDDRLEILKSVSRERIEDRELLNEFHAVLESLASASRERDRVIHSVWFNLGYEDLTDTAYRFERGESPITDSRKYQPDELDATLEQLKDATEALTTFLLNRLGMPVATPGIHIKLW